MIKKTSQIKIEVSVDENHIPEEIKWSAEDANTKTEKCKALFLNLWDHNKKESFFINLWTKEMPLYEMQMFFYQTFLSMADTYKRASSDGKLAEKIKAFGEEFAKAAKNFNNK